ncbi:MAG: NAD(P)H-binding protein [Propionibacteriaceae bacterium]|nr:NAD(P)H-binding protein [Propionibacteriaceae bacterium]
MKIVVLGATGNVGSRFTAQAVKAGHQVVAFAREPETVTAQPGVTTRQGAAEDTAALATAATGADALLVSITGPTKDVTFMQRTLPKIITAAQQAGVARIVLVSAFGAGDTAEKASGLARLIYRTLLGKFFADKAASDQLLQSSGLDWTIAYPVNLKDAATHLAEGYREAARTSRQGTRPADPALRQRRHRAGRHHHRPGNGRAAAAHHNPQRLETHLMRVHHLNCGTMRMPGAPLVCHVLLIEAGNGLLLVDTGFGYGDITDPAGRIGPYRAVIRPALVPEQTAIEQVRARGLDPRDVRHIVLTHGDSDHAGGLSDFPWASVHVTTTEKEAITRRPTWFERQRYNSRQWAHRPQLVGHAPGGETWHGFTGVTELTDIASGIALIPLAGHSRGHAAVAVDAGGRWVLHAGDSFYHPGTLDGSARPPLSLRLQEAAFAFDRPALRKNQARLGALLAEHDPTVLLVNAHDPALLSAARATT